MNEKNFILYAWNDETKEFWFLGEKIDYVHNPKEWKKYLNDLVSENKQLKEKVNQLETNRDEAIEYVKNHIHQETYTGYMDAKELMKLVSLLERGKE